MAENGDTDNENVFHRAKEQLRHGVHRVAHFRQPVETTGGGGGGGGGPQAAPPSSISSISEHNPGMTGGSNFDDFPYDPTKEDVFTSELATGAYDDDGIPSPRSQCSTLSMDTLHSSVSGGSWTSTQKTIGGLGTKEARSQDVLGPYKPNSEDRNVGAIPTDYEDYINGKPPRASHNDTTQSAGNPVFERSSSTSSERSVPDSLYADLSSVSDRDLQVPEALVRADALENGYDNEGRGSPIHTSHVREHLSNLRVASNH